MEGRSFSPVVTDAALFNDRYFNIAVADLLAEAIH
jgi:hypothetical protein